MLWWCGVVCWGCLVVPEVGECRVIRMQVLFRCYVLPLMLWLKARGLQGAGGQYEEAPGKLIAAV